MCQEGAESVSWGSEPAHTQSSHQHGQAALGFMRHALTPLKHILSKSPFNAQFSRDGYNSSCQAETWQTAVTAPEALAGPVSRGLVFKCGSAHRLSEAHTQPPGWSPNLCGCFFSACVFLGPHPQEVCREGLPASKKNSPVLDIVSSALDARRKCPRLELL